MEEEREKKEAGANSPERKILCRCVCKAMYAYIHITFTTMWTTLKYVPALRMLFPTTKKSIIH